MLFWDKQMRAARVIARLKGLGPPAWVSFAAGSLDHAYRRACPLDSWKNQDGTRSHIERALGRAWEFVQTGRRQLDSAVVVRAMTAPPTKTTQAFREKTTLLRARSSSPGSLTRPHGTASKLPLTGWRRSQAMPTKQSWIYSSPMSVAERPPLRLQREDRPRVSRRSNSSCCISTHWSASARQRLSSQRYSRTFGSRIW